MAGETKGDYAIIIGVEEVAEDKWRAVVSCHDPCYGPPHSKCKMVEQKVHDKIGTFEEAKAEAMKLGKHLAGLMGTEVEFLPYLDCMN